MRNFFETMMTDWRVVGEAENGFEAIRLAEEVNPDLILLDYSMPKMTGIETASILKKHQPKVHIVVFTIFDRAVSTKLSLSVGIDLVVPKADGLNGLVKAVHHLMGTSTLTADQRPHG
jgi:DNA-binding NarL/FixJ family response regulator